MKHILPLVILLIVLAIGGVYFVLYVISPKKPAELTPLPESTIVPTTEKNAPPVETAVLLTTDHFSLEYDFYDYVHPLAVPECELNKVSPLVYLKDKVTDRRTLIKNDLCLSGDIGTGINIIEEAEWTYVFFPFGGGEVLSWEVFKYHNQSGKFTTHPTAELEKKLAEKWNTQFHDIVWLYLQNPEVKDSQAVFNLAAYMPEKDFSDNKDFGTAILDLSSNTLKIIDISDPQYSSLNGTILQ